MIPFVDLKTQYRAIKPEILAAISDVLDKGEYVLGSAVKDFESRFSDYCGGGEAIACSSGTSALHLALAAAGIGRGDEVITVSMTFLATASAIDYVGAKPVFVDVDPISMTMDPAKIEAAITPQTRAIIPVHLYGQMADMDSIIAIARRHNLLVIEDAAQAHGAEYGGIRAGMIGDFGCFSFYPGKNLGAYGEGGLVLVRDAKRAQTVRMLRDWGQEKKYNHVLKGFNYRMDGIQGAVLGVKMRHIEAWTESRRQVATWYGEALSGLFELERPMELPGRRHVYHVYATRIDPAKRTSVQEALGKHGIASGLHYPIPVHLQPCFAELGYCPGDFPVTERIAASELSLPMYPEMVQQDVGQIATVLRDALKQ